MIHLQETSVGDLHRVPLKEISIGDLCRKENSAIDLSRRLLQKTSAGEV